MVFGVIDQIYLLGKVPARKKSVIQRLWQDLAQGVTPLIYFYCHFNNALDSLIKVAFENVLTVHSAVVAM